MSTALDEAVVWHDVECAAYDADLPLWRELAGEAAGDGPVLDVGCGTGRVALDLARRGHAVVGVDADAVLVGALGARARAEGLEVRAHAADARSFDLGREVALAIAPMQVAQLLGGSDGRVAMLEHVRAHLATGGMLAVALADPFEGIPAGDAAPPPPDVREEGGWVFSSLPVRVRSEAGATAIDRMRHAVSPAGEVTESMATIRLDAVTPDELEAEAAACGFAVRPRRSVPPTGDYVGSAVVVLEAAP